MDIVEKICSKRDFLWDAESLSIRVQVANKYDHPIHESDWQLLISKMMSLLHQTRSIRTRDLKKYLYDESKVMRSCKHRNQMGQCRHAPELACDLLVQANVLNKIKPGRYGCPNIELFRLNAEKVLFRLQGGEVITRILATKSYPKIINKRTTSLECAERLWNTMSISLYEIPQRDLSQLNPVCDDSSCRYCNYLNKIHNAWDNFQTDLVKLEESLHSEMTRYTSASFPLLGNRKKVIKITQEMTKLYQNFLIKLVDIVEDYVCEENDDEHGCHSPF